MADIRKDLFGLLRACNFIRSGCQALDIARYARYKRQPVEKGGKLWEAAILDDFKEFEARGLKHRQMAEIKALLAAK